LFLNEFNNSINGLNIKSIDDFSLETFVHQIHFFRTYQDKKRNKEKEILMILNSFYTYVLNNAISKKINNNSASKIIFQRQRLAQLIANGYEIMKYNPIEKVPTQDKWIIICEKSIHYNIQNTYTFNFSLIKNNTYRQWLKYFIWKYGNMEIET
jgi:hypothetical protein